LPTYEEIEKLYDFAEKNSDGSTIFGQNTIYLFHKITVNGVIGCKFGFGSNTLFLPNVLHRVYQDGKFLGESSSFSRMANEDKSQEAIYWSATEAGSDSAHCFLIKKYGDKSSTIRPFGTSRGNACNIRCVKK